MGDFVHHAPDPGIIIVPYSLVKFSKTQASDDPHLFLRFSNGAANECNVNFCHRASPVLTMENIAGFLAAEQGDFLGTSKGQQTLHGGHKHVVGIVRTETFGENILDAE